MSTLFDEIKEGLEEAIQHASGEPSPVRVRTIEIPDVAAVRHAQGLSQAEFAAYFGVSIDTLQGWEQRRRIPRGPASALLRVIQREPDAVRRALQDGPTAAYERAKPARPTKREPVA